MSTLRFSRVYTGVKLFGEARPFSLRVVRRNREGERRGAPLGAAEAIPAVSPIAQEGWRSAWMWVLGLRGYDRVDGAIWDLVSRSLRLSFYPGEDTGVHGRCGGRRRRSSQRFGSLCNRAGLCGLGPHGVRALRGSRLVHQFWSSPRIDQC